MVSAASQGHSVRTECRQPLRFPSEIVESEPKMKKTWKSIGVLTIALIGASPDALAQRPQDNWYLETIWDKGANNLNATNGGLSSPYGVAIGPDRRIYVADQGYSCIQVYLPDGTFSFSITNGFGAGESFSQPRGLITDKSGNLYAADTGRECVFVFDANGVYLRKIGGIPGGGNGQLSGVLDAGVSLDGEVYVLEGGNSRVSVFSTNGTFLRNWSGPGNLDGQLNNPLSLAVTPESRVYICQQEWAWGVRQTVSIKQFDRNGTWLWSASTLEPKGNFGHSYAFWLGGASVRTDPGGYAHALSSFFGLYSTGDPQIDDSPEVLVFPGDSSNFTTYGPKNTGGAGVDFRFPCHAVGPDGTTIICGKSSRNLWVFRTVLREQYAVPRNAIPIPATVAVNQRSGSPLVDIDYRITDADDTNVYAAMLVFKNGTQSLSNCISHLTLVEGTGTNLGSGITANQTHRVTWNAGADWSVNLGNFRVGVLARDSRPGLLDVHYLHLPAGNGMPALKISRSPLIPSDFMQVWWWLLATNDVGITLNSNRIYGVSGAYNGKLLCDNGATSSDGRSYVCQAMHVRQATAGEVQWAKQGTMPSGTTPNQWVPARDIGGRPASVNEYGFDTGNWDTNSCSWVVPLN